jgi:predicted metal-dependent phosphotriesterase family hydrolase
MTTVETVRGPVPAERLETVLAHEHVFVLTEEQITTMLVDSPRQFLTTGS